VEDDGGIPVIADRNWLTYNNFRSGDLTAGIGTDAADATIAQGDLCEIDCDEDKLIVWVHAGNEGAADLAPGTIVELYSVIGTTDTLIDSVTMSDSVPMGWYNESIQFDITGLSAATFDALRVIISSPEQDCDATNNEIVFTGPFCVD
jgi:hypothetical protein